MWPSITWEVGNNHKMNTQATQPKPCLAPSGRVQSLGPTGPSQELSVSHKPPWILPSCPSTCREPAAAHGLRAASQVWDASSAQSCFREQTNHCLGILGYRHWYFNGYEIQLFHSSKWNMLLSWKAALTLVGPFSEHKWDKINGLKHLLIFSLILSLFHDKVNLSVQSASPQTYGYNEVQLAATSQLVTVLLQVWYLRQRNQRHLLI